MTQPLELIAKVAMAGLLQAVAGGWDPAPPLDGRELEEATSIICEETTKVRNALTLMRGLVNSAKAKRKPGSKER